jgi:hypothetical protein
MQCSLHRQLHQVPVAVAAAIARKAATKVLASVFNLNEWLFAFVAGRGHSAAPPHGKLKRWFKVYSRMAIASVTAMAIATPEMQKLPKGSFLMKRGA